MKRISVLLADNNRIVRRELRTMLEHEEELAVVGEASNGRQAVALVKRLRPAVVLMEVALPLVNGFEATREILKAAPATKVLILSGHSEEAYVEAAIQAGAVGYLLKHTSADSVCRAIREVEKGSPFYSAAIPQRLRKGNGSRRMDGVG